jgi:hypothetical protein
LAYYDREDEEQFRFVFNLLANRRGSGTREEENPESVHHPPAKKKRHFKKVLFYTLDKDGNRITTGPTQSNWYVLYIVSPNVENKKFLKKFRRRFRLPYKCYLDLLDIVKKAENDDDGELFFRRWMSHDAVGVPSSPIKIMLLGAL